jgi:hypothetical protein
VENQVSHSLQLNQLHVQLDTAVQDQLISDKRIAELNELVMQLLQLNEVLVSKLIGSNSTNVVYKKILGIPKKVVDPAVIINTHRVMSASASGSVSGFIFNRYTSSSSSSPSAAVVAASTTTASRMTATAIGAVPGSGISNKGHNSNSRSSNSHSINKSPYKTSRTSKTSKNPYYNQQSPQQSPDPPDQVSTFNYNNNNSNISDNDNDNIDLDENVLQLRSQHNMFKALAKTLLEVRNNSNMN